ncbi:MAG: metallophosphoesterase, partial [Clostridiales bacterium]|nr:metallophosphoesterase [Clostridiales bacterium]
MIITKTRLEIGLEKPFRALHMSDNHIALADNRDDERKIKLAESRTAAFNHGKPGNVAMEEYALQLDYARSHRLPVLYTGDLCDFVSYKNLDYARDTLKDIDYFMAVGNHEFSLYVGEAFEDLPYKMKSFDLVQSYFRNDLHFASRVMGGVNFVALDNGYYRFDADQLARMKREIEKG